MKQFCFVPLEKNYVVTVLNTLKTFDVLYKNNN